MTTDCDEWVYAMRHPTWEHLQRDRELFGIDFGATAIREAKNEAMADEATAYDGVPERWEM